MWRKIAPLLVVLSVALNVAFVGVWGLRELRYRDVAEKPYDGPVWCPLYRRLGVTAEQWGRIEPRLKAFRRQSRALCKEMSSLRAGMIDILAAENPDPRAIAEKQGEIRAGQARMQKLVIEHLLAEKEVLTAEQEDKLFEMIRDQSSCSGPGRMLRLGNGNADARRRDRPQTQPADSVVNREEK